MKTKIKDTLYNRGWSDLIEYINAEIKNGFEGQNPNSDQMISYVALSEILRSWFKKNGGIFEN